MNKAYEKPKVDDKRYKRIMEVSNYFLKEKLKSNPPKFTAVLSDEWHLPSTGVGIYDFTTESINFDFLMIYSTFCNFDQSGYGDMVELYYDTILTCDRLLNLAIKERINIAIKICYKFKNRIIPILNKLETIGYKTSIIDLGPKLDITKTYFIENFGEYEDGEAVINGQKEIISCFSKQLGLTLE